MSQPSGVPAGQFNTRISNFTAGPGALPVPVLEQCQREMLNWNNCGASVMEISHRSKEFIALLEESKDSLKKLLNIPDNYAILFMQGGGNGQFATIPMNLLTAHKKPQYVVTGTWSKAALQEAKKFCAADVASSTESTKFRSIPPSSEWQLDQHADYIYYCSNETINGVEFQSEPHVPEHVPLIADMSSNFLSRPIDVSKFGLIWAGAQKNTGIAGLTVVIVRKDLLSRCPANIPQVMNYNVMHEHNSSYNTPPTFAIYVSGLVFKWLLELGGLEAMEKINQQKAELLYSYIDNSNFYINEIDHACRSRMNVPFKISVGNDERNKQLEQLFAKEANKRGLIGLEGHRSVGGLRASLYNAVSLDDVKGLVTFMKEFAAQHVNDENYNQLDNILMSSAAHAAMLKLIAALQLTASNTNVDVCRSEREGLFFVVKLDSERTVTGTIDGDDGLCTVFHANHPSRSYSLDDNEQLSACVAFIHVSN